MKYFSLNKKAPVVSFKEAVIKGLAPDRGLYFPEAIKPLEKSFFAQSMRFIAFSQHFLAAFKT